VSERLLGPHEEPLALGERDEAPRLPGHVTAKLMGGRMPGILSARPEAKRIGTGGPMNVLPAHETNKEPVRYEPNIVGFLCNWCSYAGADLAGISRFQYPPNLKVVRVMCSGRVDPAFILKAFENGADGVLVGGCHIGDCHYQRGNETAKEQVEMTKELLQKIGINGQRLRLEWVSASEGQRFAQVVTEFTKEVSELGPLDKAGGGRE